MAVFIFDQNVSFAFKNRLLFIENLRRNWNSMVYWYLYTRALNIEKIFGDDGLSVADESSLFDKRREDAINESKDYPKFLSYFKKRVSPALKNYVVDPAIKSDLIPNWKNNNCESLNHIMKLDAKWKTRSTPKLIELIKDIVTLHY